MAIACEHDYCSTWLLTRMPLLYRCHVGVTCPAVETNRQLLVSSCCHGHSAAKNNLLCTLVHQVQAADLACNANCARCPRPTRSASKQYSVSGWPELSLVPSSKQHCTVAASAFSSEGSIQSCTVGLLHFCSLCLCCAPLLCDCFTGGVRVGAPALTTRGMKEAEFTAIADFLHRAAQIALKIQVSTIAQDSRAHKHGQSVCHQQ